MTDDFVKVRRDDLAAFVRFAERAGSISGRAQDAYLAFLTLLDQPSAPASSEWVIEETTAGGSPDCNSRTLTNGKHRFPFNSKRQPWHDEDQESLVSLCNYLNAPGEKE